MFTCNIATVDFYTTRYYLITQTLLNDVSNTEIFVELYLRLHTM